MYTSFAKSSFLHKGLYYPTVKLKSTLRPDNETEILRNRSLYCSVRLRYYISVSCLILTIERYILHFNFQDLFVDKIFENQYFPECSCLSLIVDVFAVGF